MSAEDERAAVVAWLREMSAKAISQAETKRNPFRMAIGYGFAQAFRAAADAIERGDHITPGGENAKN